MKEKEMEKPESEIEISIEPAEKEEEGEEEGDEEEGMGMEKDWKAECDANDLLRAQEIKSDPARMKAAMAILSNKKAAIESMEDLKAARKAAMLRKED